MDTHIERTGKKGLSRALNSCLIAKPHMNSAAGQLGPKKGASSEMPVISRECELQWPGKRTGCDLAADIEKTPRDIVGHRTSIIDPRSALSAPYNGC